MGMRRAMQRDARGQLRRAGGLGSGEADGVVAVGVRGYGVAHPETLLLVGLQHVGEAEALPADVARVGLLARVRPAVALHVGPAGEALPTDLADIWLFA